MNPIPQIALLCLLNPELVIATVKRMMGMLTYSHTPFPGLSPEEMNNPVLLFDLAMREFVAFQEDLLAQHQDFIEPLGKSSA